MESGFLRDRQQDAATCEIAGLVVNVFGLSCLTTVSNPDLVFVLHGRTQKAADYEEFCSTILASNFGALIVSFDQRNHGHRLLSATANGTWADGNVMHG